MFSLNPVFAITSHKSDWNNKCNRGSQHRSECRSADAAVMEKGEQLAGTHNPALLWESFYVLPICLGLCFQDLSRLIRLPHRSITAGICTPFYYSKIGSGLVCAPVCVTTYTWASVCVCFPVLLLPSHYDPSSVRLIFCKGPYQCVEIPPLQTLQPWD